MRIQKTITIFTIFLAATILCAPGTHAASKNSDRGLFSDTLTEDILLTLEASTGMSLTLDHSFGDIEVIQGENTKIHLTGKKTVTARSETLAQEFLEAMELRVKERGTRISIETYYPEDEFGKRDRKRIRNFSISYKIEIPENTELRINNSFGDIDMHKLSGEFSVTNGFGKVYAVDLTGNTEINNKFASLTAENIRGDASINNEHGSLDIKTVAGTLVAKTSFGKARVINVTGNTRVTNSHGDVTAEEIGGDAEIATSFATASCSRVKGRATIRNSHGKVNVGSVERDVRVNTSFGKVRAENIKGNVTVENKHASVEVSMIGGDADVRTSFGSALVKKVIGGVTVTNEHSSITAQDILPPRDGEERQVKLKTSFGSIRVELPDKVSARVKAHTSNGKFECEFPLLVNLQGVVLSSSTTKNIEGEIGDGKDYIELEGSHSSVYLEKSTTDDWDFIEFFLTTQMFYND